MRYKVVQDKLQIYIKEDSVLVWDNKYERSEDIMLDLK